MLPIPEIAGYVICEYKWWLALVLRTLIGSEELEVIFLHPAGTSRSFSFPKPADELVIVLGHIITVVHLTIATERACQLNNSEAAAATAKLAQKLI